MSVDNHFKSIFIRASNKNTIEFVLHHHCDIHLQTSTKNTQLSMGFLSHSSKFKDNMDIQLGILFCKENARFFLSRKHHCIKKCIVIQVCTN